MQMHVVMHELAHIILGRAFGARPVPRWLQEGVAQLVAREYTQQLTDRIGAGMFGDNLLSLEELSTGFPAEPLRAQLAYAQSADFVAFLNNTYGQQALHRIIREMASGEPFAAAVRIATGDSVATIDSRWRQRLSGSDMLWLRPLVSDTMLLATAGLAFLGLGVAALRRRREQFRAMAAKEADVDAWYAQLSEGFGALSQEQMPLDPYAQVTFPANETGHQSAHGPH